MTELFDMIGSARGRKAKTVAMEFTRELGPSDLDLILNPPPVEAQPFLISKIRNTHHRLARLMAEGRKEVQISDMTGYSLSRLSILKNDPAFQELLAYYKAQLDETYLNVHERMATLGVSAVEELQERLEDAPEKFSNRDLLEVAEKMLDRAVPALPGAAAQSVAPALTINFVAPGGPVITGTIEP